MPHNMKFVLKNASRRPKKPAAPAPVAAPEPVAAPVEWSMGNTKAELTTAAEAAGIVIKSGWNKAEILGAIQGL